MAKNKGLGRDFYSLIDDNMPEAKPEAKTTIKISRITMDTEHLYALSLQLLD